MTRSRTLSLAGALAVGTGALIMLVAVIPLQTGCETQSAEGGQLRVEPHSIGISINQSIEFTATGGFSYEWSLSDDNLGVLTRKTGPTTTYISRFNPGTNKTAVIQHLTVTSVVGGTHTSTDTNNDGTTNTTTTGSGFIDTDEAIIEHLPTGDQGTVTSTSTTTSTTAGTSVTTTSTTSTSTTASAFPPLPGIVLLLKRRSLAS
ncbi:MAG: hypothetical protein K8T26_00355 [Lentisphaerae bacterium]|nr:hypothetical protein [Lentisphaerota bacterium]